MSSALAAVLALIFICWLDGIGKSKNSDKKLYKPGTIFIGRNSVPDDGYFVYKFDPYEILFEGSFKECQDWMKNHLSDE